MLRRVGVTVTGPFYIAYHVFVTTGWYSIYYVALILLCMVSSFEHATLVTCPIPTHHRIHWPTSHTMVCGVGYAYGMLYWQRC